METGSYNYSRNADKENAENVVVIDGFPDVAATYLREWARLFAESE